MGLASIFEQNKKPILLNDLKNRIIAPGSLISGSLEELVKGGILSVTNNNPKEKEFCIRLSGKSYTTTPEEKGFCRYLTRKTRDIPEYRE